MHPSESVEQIKFASVTTAAATGDNTLVSAVAAAAPLAAKRIRVVDYMLVAAGSVTVAFESSVSGPDMSGVMSLIAGVQNTPGFSPVGHFETAAGSLLNLRQVGAVLVSGYIAYQEV